MPVHELRPRWRESFARMRCEPRRIEFPHADSDLSQDREWCEVSSPSDSRRLRLHDYHEIYAVRGLYEQIFYQKLQCNSPVRVVNMLDEVMADFGEDIRGLRVLDVGAGNGMVGEELRAHGARKLVGIDIIEAAREAALRDRPEVYDAYHVADLTDLSEGLEEKLRKVNFNALTSVAALGFGDIPAPAFLKALDMVEAPGWLAFNLKEDFLSERDDTGFAKLIRQLNREEIIQTQMLRRYQHRLSIKGEPLHYVAVVARKLVDLPDHLMERVN